MYSATVNQLGFGSAIAPVIGTVRSTAVKGFVAHVDTV